MAPQVAVPAAPPKFYRRRDHAASPFYKVVSSHFSEFERVYPEKFQKQYGFWRPVIRRSIDKFVKCGDLKEGFARVRCGDCGEEMLVAFSCRQRGCCPSCGEKRALLLGHRLTTEVLSPVSHRQWVFTVPKRLRIYFRYDRRLLGKLCRKVYIADNAGNTLCQFGQYGNTDSRGGLPGPGETIAESGIPLAWPTSVGASEDFVYVANLINARLVRVQMAYAIDNIPGLTDHGLGVAIEEDMSLTGPTMTSAPNPFNPESRICITLPHASFVDLRVYDVGGRLVRTLASQNLQVGVHRFTWNAKDERGGNVSAGVYVYRLAAGRHVLMEKAVLAK